MTSSRSQTSKILPFSNNSTTHASVTASNSNRFMKTANSIHRLLPDAYGINILEEARVAAFTAEIDFKVELRQDQPRQSLLCGLVNPEFSKGIAIAIDPCSGTILDVLNGMGPLGYLTATPVLPTRPLHCELRIQKFGKNHICTVFIEGESIMYPAFVSGTDLVFNAVVGSDVQSGTTASYRKPVLNVGSLAKVA